MRLIGDLDPAYVHGWQDGIGFASPELMDENTLLSRRLYNTFYFAIMEKAMQGWYTNTVQLYDEDIEGYTFGTPDSFGEEEFLDRFTVRDRLINILSTYRSTYLSYNWITKEAWDQMSGTTFWYDVLNPDIDAAFLRPKMGQDANGNDYYDVIADNDFSNYTIHQLEDPLLWKAVGIMWIYMRYEYIEDHRKYGEIRTGAAEDADTTLYATPRRKKTIYHNPDLSDFGFNSPGEIYDDSYDYNDPPFGPTNPTYPNQSSATAGFEGEHTTAAENDFINSRVNLVADSANYEWQRNRYTDDTVSNPYEDVSDYWFHFGSASNNRTDNNGFSIYATDIDRTPIVSEMRFGAVLDVNNYKELEADNSSLDFTGVTGAWSSSYPELDALDPDVAIATPVTSVLQPNGFTYCTFNSADFVGDGSLISDAVFPVRPGPSANEGSGAPNLSVTENARWHSFQIQIRKEENVAATNRDRPFFLNNMLTDAKYFAEPQP